MNYKAILVYLVLSFPLFSFTPNSDEWILFWDDEQFSCYYMYNSKTMKMNGEDMEFDIKLLFYGDHLENERYVDYITLHTTFKCGENKFSVSDQTTYYVDGTTDKSSLLNTASVKDGDPIGIFYRIMCAD